MRHNIHVSFVTWLSTLQSLLLCPLTSGIWTTASYTKKLLWWGVRAASVYGYRARNLERCLIVCPFSKIIIVTFSLGLWNFQPRVLTRNVLLTMVLALNVIRKWLGAPLTLVHPWASVQVGHYCNSWYSKPGKSADDFSSSAVFQYYEYQPAE